MQPPPVRFSPPLTPLYDAELRANLSLSRAILSHTAPHRLLPHRAYLHALRLTRRLSASLPSLRRAAIAPWHRPALSALEHGLLVARARAAARTLTLPIAQDVFALLSQFLGAVALPEAAVADAAALQAGGVRAPCARPVPMVKRERWGTRGRKAGGGGKQQKRAFIKSASFAAKPSGQFDDGTRKYFEPHVAAWGDAEVIVETKSHFGIRWKDKRREKELETREEKDARKWRGKNKEMRKDGKREGWRVGLGAKAGPTVSGMRHDGREDLMFEQLGRSDETRGARLISKMRSSSNIVDFGTSSSGAFQVY